ncbi:MAG TPA: hypothetical protein VKY39_06205 [Aggregatilineales bacterium]|nr:hypothetical protein [Aggregatilineales bacterium]
MMRAWGAYALTALGLTALAAAVTAWLVEAPSTLAVWVGAGVALIVQLAAFAALVALRDRGPLFLAGWLGGMLLRFGAVGVMGVWLSRTDALPRSAAMVSLVGFVFLLLLLEPVFLRRKLTLS